MGEWRLLVTVLAVDLVICTVLGSLNGGGKVTGSSSFNTCHGHSKKFQVRVR